MQKLGLLGMIIAFILTACSSTNGYDQTQLRHNLLQETWMRSINLNPNNWVKGTDAWFLTGAPNRIEQYNNAAPPSKAMTTLKVRVPDLTNVNISGDFQVQLVGRTEHNSVYIMGPHQDTRQIIVEMMNNTLYIHKAKDSKACLKNVIVRINIHNLQLLKNVGISNIYGRDITSDHLMIESYDSGNIFLVGNMKLANVNQTGTGSIIVIGAHTPALSIKAIGKGNVKINGRVGIQNILHQGNGEVAILGADSDSLAIQASGNGLTTVVGYVSLKKISAKDSSRVYVYWTNSPSLYVAASGKAQIGLAGATTNMNIDITDASCFDGQYLQGNTIYVRTRDWSHANVSSDKKIFAAALGNSSIYTFGSPTMVSRYTSQKGAIIPIGVDSPPSAPAPRKIIYYHKHRGYKGE
ncbi:MAG: hypothetical protein K0R24_110 [Gammaproteobacteria bacterium]|jgi:hypothetical protein|nr:hypothetical protein [Gammaproteobacteria bacterium]